MGGSGVLDGYYKPVLAMVASQGIYAAMALSAEAALAEGMKPMIFVVYRQAIGALFLLISTILTRGSRGILRQMSLSFRAFGLLLVATLLGCTLSHYFYYQGLSMTSSSMATAMTNTVPAITFIMAASVGQEKVRCDLRSMAKVLGTIICVGGAFCMTFLRGPGLLNMSSQNQILLIDSAAGDWVAGSLLLIASSCGWAILLVMQSSICRQYSDALSLSTLMTFLATSMSALLTFLLEQDLSVWKITSLLQLFSCLFAGIFCSGVCFYLQSWCISMTGPLFPALFDPLCAVITTALASTLLREKLYVGGLVGAVAIVIGLYVVLWGKAEDFDYKSQLQAANKFEEVTISIDAKQSDGDLSKPLISDKANNV